jgi:hypothetical protein
MIAHGEVVYLEGHLRWRPLRLALKQMRAALFLSTPGSAIHPMKRVSKD